MQVKDALNNALNEGDIVAYSLALGQTCAAQIVKIDYNLTALGPQQRAPVVVIQIHIPIPANPQGQVGGIVKAATENFSPNPQP